ncbi:ABC transporter substrate-binding protein [Kribbella sp. CA-247076]|uniref:ABC transporter substrate-binding protein n=1 Tax=Kribbella sp. CA-247076 TaxID=3239941 RepID=UPI003D8E2917
MNKIAYVASIALTTGALFATAACTGGAPGTGSGDVQQDTSEQQEIRYMIGQPEDPADLELIKSDLKTFESKNPGITVKLDVIPSENVRTVLQTQLRSGEGPDVFGYDTGPGFAGALAKAGLVYDLTGAYDEHDWPIYDFAKKRVTFDGKIVGVPSQIEEVGVFYNKTLFAKYGIAQPKTLPELTAAAEKLKQNNVVPLAVSDKEGWQGGHLLSMALSSAVGSKGMDDLLNGRTSWNSQPVVDSLAVWKDWNDKGLLTPSPTAVTYDNANALFYSGKAAMNPTGSWLALDIERNAKFEVGFVPFPAKDGPGIFSGGLGSGTFVSASTTKAEASIKFLDYLLTPEHGRWAAEKLQDIPAYPIDTNGMTASPLFKQVLDDSAKIADGTGDFGYNIDVLTTDVFNNAMWKGIQGVLSDQAEPAQVAAQLQAAYEKSAK